MNAYIVYTYTHTLLQTKSDVFMVLLAEEDFRGYVAVGWHLEGAVH